MVRDWRSWPRGRFNRSNEVEMEWTGRIAKKDMRLECRLLARLIEIGVVISY
jgi:hypothetical protein